MATETTRLLDSYIVNIPKDNEKRLIELDKTKGLSLEELMPFENDPWWQNLRKTFFLSYWITVIIIFIAACSLSIFGHNSCNNTATTTTTTTLISNTSKQIPSTSSTIMTKDNYFHTITSATLGNYIINKKTENIQSTITTEKIINQSVVLQ